MAEERGQVNAINETMNEEEKYSGVLRSGAPGKYQPPPARSSPSPTQKNKPPIIVSSPTKPAFSYSAAAASKLPPKKNPPKITTNAKHQSFQTPPPQTAYPTITKRESSTNKYPQSAKTEHPPSSAWTDENGSPATSSSVKSTTTKPGRAVKVFLYLRFINFFGKSQRKVNIHYLNPQQQKPQPFHYRH